MCLGTQVLTHDSAEQRAQNNLICGPEVVSSDQEIKRAGTLTEPPDEEPLSKGLPFRSLDGEIDRNTEERISKPIVGRGLGGDDPS